MKKFFSGPELFFIALGAAVILLIFRPYLLGHKILFPSNLLVSTYAPWKYEPVPEYPHGPPNKPIGFDDVRQFYPNRKFLRESLLKGIVPLWNPYIYSGTPFMAALDTSVWYPISWIAALLPIVEGWNFLVIIQPILSLWFMYLFLRSLKFERHIAAYGAFTYAFSGWMIVYWQEILVLEHSFLWLPLALYASNRLWQRPRDHLGLSLLIIALACSVFGGFLQMSIYVYGVVLGWNIFSLVMRRSDREARDSAMIILTGIALSILIGGIQLIPSVEAFLLSPRGMADGGSTFQRNLLSLTHLITIIAPDYWGNPATYNYFGGNGFYFEKTIFVGVIPLLFALYGMFEVRKRTAVLFWTCMAIVTLSMGFALPTSWFPYTLHIPVLSNSYPTRIFAVTTFSLIVLSVYGLSAFLREPKRIRMLVLLSVLTLMIAVGYVVAASAWCILHQYRSPLCEGKIATVWNSVNHMVKFDLNLTNYATVTLRNLVLPTIFILSGWILLMSSRISKRLLYIYVLCIVIASSFLFAQKYVYFSDRRFVYPHLAVTKKISTVAGYDRVWGYGNAFLEKNITQYYGWYSTDGYGNLSPARYAELLSTIVNDGKLGGVIRRSDTDMYEASERDSMSANPYRLRMMSLFGVRYVLEAKVGDLKDTRTTEERFPASLFTLAWQDDTWRLWQYTPALPRVIFATNYLVKNRTQDIVTALYDPHINLGDTVILEEEPGIALTTAKPTKAHADIVSYDANTVTIRTDSDADGFVLLTDNYYPGWVASVDGKREKVYRADYAFKAVFVTRGTHTVVFQYMPQSVIIGGVTTFGGIILFVALLFRKPRKRPVT